MTSPNSSDQRRVAAQIKSLSGLGMIAGAIAAVDWRWALAVSGLYLVIDSLTPDALSAKKEEGRP